MILATSSTRTLRRGMITLALAASVLAAGCTSSGRSVSLYGGQSVAVAKTQKTEASKDLRKLRREVKASERREGILKRAIARDEKRLKRKNLSKKRRDRWEKRLARNEKELKTLKREMRRLARAERRAERSERRAVRRLDRARRAEANAKRRAEIAAKREADDARIARAKLDAADQERPRRRGLGLFGGRDYETDTDDTRRVASLRGRLFASRDPALANVSEYGARFDNGFDIDAIPLDKVNKRYYRQRVKYRTKHKPGTVVVDPHAKFLYVVEAGGKAMRYGIGVGREGFEWSGEAHIGFKRVWPKWTPPVEMIERQPHLAKYCADCGGMPGGPANPLGARALYLVANGQDTLYRLHGTPRTQ